MAFMFLKNTTWENVKVGEEISVQIETNKALKKIDPYCCGLKALISGKLETVSTEVSRHVFFFIGEEEGRVDGSMLSIGSTVACPSLVVDSKYRSC